MLVGIAGSSGRLLRSPAILGVLPINLSPFHLTLERCTSSLLNSYGCGVTLRGTRKLLHSGHAYRLIPSLQTLSWSSAGHVRSDQSSGSSASAGSSLLFLVNNEDGTRRVAESLAGRVAPGDVILLYGPVGAGKSYFSRCLIRALAGDPALRIPSPTFLLLNTYDDSCGLNGIVVNHFDLYRLTPSPDLARLGWQQALETGEAAALERRLWTKVTLVSQHDGVNLVEWPERLGTSLPPERLEISIEPQEKPIPFRKLDASQERETFVEDESEEQEEEDDGGEFVDDRCRAMQLAGYGPRWQAIVEELRPIFGQ